MPFVYSTEAVNKLEQGISAERLAAYIATAKGDRNRAISLYEFNIRASEGLYGILQALEVSLRNSIHNVMTSDMGCANWYDFILLKETEQKRSRMQKQTLPA
jgi:hypothetical protein